MRAPIHPFTASRILMTTSRTALLSVLMMCSATTSSVALADEASDVTVAAALDRIRMAGMGDAWAYQRLADLCDKIGPRISGSRQAEAAVEQIAGALKAGGLTVTLQPVKVPHWIR